MGNGNITYAYKKMKELEQLPIIKKLGFSNADEKIIKIKTLLNELEQAKKRLKKDKGSYKIIDSKKVYNQEILEIVMGINSDIKVLKLYLKYLKNIYIRFHLIYHLFLILYLYNLPLHPYNHNDFY